MNTAPQTITATPISIEELQVMIGVKLGELDNTWLPLVDVLLRATQRQLAGFQTPAARHAIAQAQAHERELDVLDREVRAGRQWMRPEQRLVGGANTPTPAATLGALDLSEEISFRLHDIVRRTLRALNRAGVCPIVPRLRAEPTSRDLIAHVRALVWTAPSKKLLTDIDRDLTWLNDAADRLVNGDAKTALPDPCPHCHRPTLVVYFRDDVIICGRDPKTRRNESCVCNDPICECKTSPVTYRHEWIRVPASARNSWRQLSSALKFARAKETK